MRRLLCIVLLLALITVGPSACSRSDVDNSDSGTAVPSDVATSAEESETGTAPVDPDDGSLDADAIEKELEAIERELNSTALPDDSDFSEIEDGL